MTTTTSNKLLILWTSGDRDVALGMALMYAVNAQRHGWWDLVTLLVWGPSQKLMLADEEVRRCVDDFKAAGGRLIACKSCAEMFGVAEELADAGVEVFGAGMTLTNWLKSDCPVVTF